MESSSTVDPPASAPVLSRVDGPIGRITLNRPRARNAITVALSQELEAALRDLAPHVRVIVIRGAGGHFSAGGDFHEVQRLRAEGVEALGTLFSAFRRACDLIAELPVPVVAAVEGDAMAGGFELLQAADIALVRDDARLADNHSNFAMVGGGGGSQRLARIVGRPRALGHILTGDRISGLDAVAWGLAYESAPEAEFDAALDVLLAGLASKDRVAQARTKALVRGGLDGPLAAGLDREFETVLTHLSDPDGSGAADGIAGFVAGRDPGAPR
jgi:enoyl-CoA hydratase/carnithine racemase